MADLSALNMGLMMRNQSAIEHFWRQVKALTSANMDPHLRPLAASVASQTRQLREHIADDQVGATELKDVTRNALMRPLSSVLATSPSFARQAAQQLGKDVTLQMDNLDLQLEERVLQEIAEPSMHLLRNAVAHGIESPAERRAAGKLEKGGIVASAAQEGDMVRLAIADDGRGLDVARIGERAVSLHLMSREALEALSEHERTRLAFEPGLSTQGVGLDVVKAVVQRMGAPWRSIVAPTRVVHSSYGCRFPNR